MLPRDLANCALRQVPIGRSTGIADTDTGGATIAASSGGKLVQAPRCTAIVDDPTASVSAMSASA
jgi:hypothetical protein